ncbi:hypothetical protein PoB_003140800 [Plakobranchus ocellatus]|uniref:Uncharacterized protein n=1 Tax=Plakobranchus ocellatus TaxID=259542 RepID=A0AAV4AEB4_9GAST|nr:hypothetical protein PoB_003140800 [Plakobranchus ocellatus]
MFPWDDRRDGRPTDTTLLNTLAPMLVAHGLLTHEIPILRLNSRNDLGLDWAWTLPPRVPGSKVDLRIGGACHRGFLRSRSTTPGFECPKR